MRSLFPTLRRLLAIGLCAVTALAAGCARQQAPAPKTKPVSLFVDKQPKPKKHLSKLVAEEKKLKASAPQLKITEHGVTLNWAAKEGTQMSATAKSASFNEVLQTGSLLDFSGKLYENDKLTATVTAPRAEADTKNRTVTATGGVVLKSLERKTVVKAKWIRWYANAHKVVGDGGVKIQSESGTITGAAFVADTALRTVTVKDSGKGLKF